METKRFDVVALGELPQDAISDCRIFHFGTLSMTHEGVRKATCKAIDLTNVTAGAEGSYSCYEDQQVFVPACKLGGTIETTGAGDTFCARVLNYVLEHSLNELTTDDLSEMLRFANTAAYLVATRKGAIRPMPGQEDVAAIL